MGTMRSSPFPATPVARTHDHGVTVRWCSADTDADEALRRHVALVLDVDPDSVQVGRLCGRCGSSRHGRAWANHGVHVSLARSGPHLVTAVSTSGPVGVDVESVTGVDRAWDDLPPDGRPETAPPGTGRTAVWCRTEAVLKREGIGFSAPLRGDPLERGIVDDLVAPDGYCAAVAYAGP